ncbi:MAG: transcriptional regulator, partial [Bacteroidales bacterium]|nr:transcriptional regulator [Bacteroidales bacterium]
EIRCVMFYGNEIEKPFPAYQVYKGNVFQLVDQAVDFVLSRINLFVGDRKQSVDVPVRYEIPRSAISEAIVNAIAHRDYTSNGSVQIMLFRNRLEVWNPGQLPLHLSIDKLKKTHGSYPTNPLLAEPLYLAGYIERLGTGIPDMINRCIEAGLAEPEFFQEDSFKVILWRKLEKIEQLTEQVNRLILVMEELPFSLNELMLKLELKHRPTFMYNYLKPALENNWMEMTNPETPNNPNQRYRLTKQGMILKAGLK